LSGLIEDYALIGNGQTVALVGKDGSIDWLGFPRFDSDACFAALLGREENGRWQITTVAEEPRVKRRYRPGTLVLETEFTTAGGTVVLIDCMDGHAGRSDVFRLVRGVRGQVAMRMELIIRFGYGSVVPWVSRESTNRLRAVAGPEQLTLITPVPFRGEEFRTLAEFSVSEGQDVPFSLTWTRSFREPPDAPDVRQGIERVSKAWEEWSSRYQVKDEWTEAVLRSLITLKALSHNETGGIVAAGTTSLPEELGGVRNWDYRFCWLRDATFTLYALMSSGYIEEAKAWRDWLVRAAAGHPDQMQIMYGVAGERRLTEYEVPWLIGYADSKPVRIGNAASEQVQLDVYGEVLDLLYQSRRNGLPEFEASWALERALVRHLDKIWSQPDEGIWEVRGGPRQFTHSKVMAWVALDRAVRTIEEFGANGPLDKWRALRSDIHDEVCRSGFNRELNSFVQYFGSNALDASLLLLPIVGFLPPEDPRIQGTVAAIEKTLLHDGFVSRYDTHGSVDGLQGSEGVFLACSFWLADNYVLQHRHGEARDLFERLLTLRNDVGLLSEEYDPRSKRLLGNFPQAFSHVSLVNTAHNLSRKESPVANRSGKTTGAASRQ
jgi:GH15 family glucan-1,4-alpha-glucosidase